VICDRFADSTRVYQGVLGQVDPRAIRALERIVVGETRPDLTFVLDVPVEEGLKRATVRRGEDKADRFEGEAVEFHKKLRDAFLALAAKEPNRCLVIDATRPKQEVADEIWRIVNQRFDPATAPIQFEGTV
jgi:dTMP kinase